MAKASAMDCNGYHVLCSLLSVLSDNVFSGVKAKKA